MSFRRFGRARGFGIRYGRGLGIGYTGGLGLGWKRGLGTRFLPYGYYYPSYTHQYPPYAVSNPSQYASSPMQVPFGYQQLYPQKPSTGTTLTAVHTNCAHFNNGFCTLKGSSVPANGPACPSFTPRI
jgi:hypothetical protein